MSAENRSGGQRIVSLAPSATSILVALGAGCQLVGVTQWCADVARLPARLRSPRRRSGQRRQDGQAPLGDCWSLDVERVLELRPTLVIGSVPYKQETVARLLEHPLTFLAMNPRTLADIYSDIRLLGRIVGREAAARRLVARMRRAFAQVTADSRRALRDQPGGKPESREERLNTDSTEKAQRARRTRRFAGASLPLARDKQGKPRVYCEAWPNPRISSPPWVAELVEIAGGQTVLPAGARVRDEEVAQARPDVIVIAWAAAGARPRATTTLANPAWQDVPAIINRRVHVVRDELLNTPGPPLIEGARELFRVIHFGHDATGQAEAPGPTQLSKGPGDGN